MPFGNVVIRFITLVLSIALAFPLISSAATQQSLSQISEAEADKIRVKNGKSHLPIITIEEFRNRFAEVLVVDARSEFEYDTLHISGAYSIPVSNMGFDVRIKKLMSEHPGKDFVFYCNGFVCGKSYAATERCLRAGFKNVFAFDRGIFAWANKYPELSVRLGQKDFDRKQLVSDDIFNAHTLPAEKFMDQLEADRSKGAMMVDIRSASQQNTYLPFPSSRMIETDAFVKRLDMFKNKPLYIIDQAGEQVRWLQYHLEENGIQEYYFLKGGISSYDKEDACCSHE